MNGKDSFLGLKYVGDDLIELAEYMELKTEDVEKNSEAWFGGVAA